MPTKSGRKARKVFKELLVEGFPVADAVIAIRVAYTGLGERFYTRLGK